MSYIQSSSGSGTGSAAATLAGVTVGSRLVAFAWNGSTTTPTAHSVADAQATYTALDAAITDSGNLIWAQSFELLNANAGSHTITFTTDAGTAAFIWAAEMSAPTTGASTAKGAFQASPGTANDAISGGSVTVAASATLLAFSSDTAAVGAGSIPTQGTSFASRDSGSNATMGSWRAETLSVSSNTAGTFTAQNGTDGAQSHITIAVAVPDPAVAATPATPTMGRRTYLMP